MYRAINFPRWNWDAYKSMFRRLLSRACALVEWRRKVTNMDVIVSTVVLTFATLRAYDRSVVLLSANKAQQHQQIMTSEIAGVFLCCFLHIAVDLCFIYEVSFHRFGWIWAIAVANERARAALWSMSSVCVCGIVTLIYLHCRCSCIDLLATNLYCEMCAHF